jgi:hypothetical protein
MKFMMATEAQRLISISLAKIAASRCVRGGVSLHKNLLVATVLQKARYIFMEEAFHTLHGHYINQANSKFIQQLRYQEQLENQLRQQQQQDKEFHDDGNDSTLDDSELDIFSSSNESLNFLSESENKGNPSLAQNSSPPSSSSSADPLIYLDLDVNRTKSNHDQNSSIISSGQKRRLSSDEYDSEDSLMSIFPTKSKQMKFSNDSDNNNSTDITSDNCLSLDFLSNDLSLTSDHQNTNSDDNSPTHRTKPTTTATANVTMTPLDMSNNTSASTTSPSTSSIDRITSLVSIFNFGNLQRSVSTPDLCSSSSNHATVEKSCCNLQRQIAMTV